MYGFILLRLVRSRFLLVVDYSTHRQKKSHVEVENARGEDIQQDAVNI